MKKAWSFLIPVLFLACGATPETGRHDGDSPEPTNDGSTPSLGELPDGPLAPDEQAPDEDPSSETPSETPPDEPGDQTPPGLATRVPAPDTVDVGTDAVIEVQLDEAIDCDHLAQNALELTEVPGTLSCAQNQAGTLLRLTPAAPLVAGSSYEVVLRGTLIADSSGNAMADTQWSFTTLALPGEPAILVGAGDIASCGLDGDTRTAALLDNIPGTVFTLGDTAYDSSSATEMQNCYDPTWGRHKARTKPTIGNHEYLSPNAGPYFDYFGEAAGPRGKAYYSYEAGPWHVVVLNSNCGEVGGCGASSPQGQWLKADLEAHPTSCTLATMHHPRFSSGNHGGSTEVQPLWQVLYDHDADLVLAGHDHDYERFGPMDPSGTLDDARGMRSFVVGTGGIDQRAFPNNGPHSEAKQVGTWGVMKLTLYDGSYDWEFVPVAGKTYTDSGTGVCH